MSQSRLTLCVFIDAFGWQILQRNRFMEDELPVRGPLQTVFGYSSTCDPTILTGCSPREHGHFSFFTYNPETSPFRRFRWLGLLPAVLTRRGRVRRAISRWMRGRLRYTGYFQIYNVPFHRLPMLDYSEKRDLYQPGGILGGQETVFDRLRSGRVPFSCSDWRLPEERNLADLGRAIDAGGIRFAYLYLAAMDATLHAEGTRSPNVAAKIAWYDQQLRGLLDRARRQYGDVRMFVFSDHGMADVGSTLDVQARIEPLGLQYGVDYAAVYDSTMARFWFLRDGVRERVEAALQGVRGGRLLSDADLAGWGCDFEGQRYGHLFFLADPGVLICPSYMGQTALRGMHGYAPDHADSVAMFATNAADVEPPHGLADLHHLMCAEAGV